VRDVRVLERLADGLGIPRGHLRLAGVDGRGDAYLGQGGTDPEVDEGVRRRALIAATSLAALGRWCRVSAN